MSVAAPAVAQPPLRCVDLENCVPAALHYLPPAAAGTAAAVAQPPLRCADLIDGVPAALHSLPPVAAGTAAAAAAAAAAAPRPLRPAAASTAGTPALLPHPVGPPSPLRVSGGTHQKQHHRPLPAWASGVRVWRHVDQHLQAMHTHTHSCMNTRMDTRMDTHI